jgi:hypothetical protein
VNLRPYIFVLAVVLGALLACNVPSSNETYTQTKLPDQASFPPVSAMLAVHCGSLDCHGNVARNLRVYGSAGLRFSSTDEPFVPLCNTADEVTQDYTSVVGLEPEQIDAVAAGADPGTLTMVRKARGTEAHKGEQIWAQGDDSDVCLVSWLTGAPNSEACASSLTKALPSTNNTPNPLVSCITQPSDQ